MEDIPIYDEDKHCNNEYNVGDVVWLQRVSIFYVCTHIDEELSAYQAQFKQISPEKALKLWQERNNLFNINIF